MYKAVKDFRHGGKDFRVGDVYDGSDLWELTRVGLIVKTEPSPPMFHVEQPEVVEEPKKQSPKFILKKQKRKVD